MRLRSERYFPHQRATGIIMLLISTENIQIDKKTRERGDFGEKGLHNSSN